MVPTSDPGFTHTPIHTIGEASTYATYYTDLRVPAENVIGEPGEGWRVITTQLNHERVALCSSGSLERPFTEVVEWARQTKLADGSRVIDREWVRVHLARIQAKLSGAAAVQLEGRAGRRGAGRRPTPRPPRCGAPSSTARPTACCWRCSARPAR